jgi:hypothetical protein
VKRVEHLKNGFLNVLLDRNTRAESATRLIRIEDDRHQLALRAFPERTRDLTHHGDIENVQRRLREGDPRHPILDPKLNVLVHPSNL